MTGHRRIIELAVPVTLLVVAGLAGGCTGRTPPRDAAREAELAARLEAAGRGTAWYANLQLTNGTATVWIEQGGLLAAIELGSGVRGDSPAARQVCQAVLSVAVDPNLGPPLGISNVEVDSTGPDNLRAECSTPATSS